MTARRPTRSHDAGLSNERTGLAWQRTALALVAGTAIVGRLTLPAVGPVSLACLVVNGSLGLWTFAEGRSRYAQGSGRRLRSRPRGGRAAAATAAATLLLCLTEAVAVMAA